jgi:hypothetical protein
MNKKDMVFGSKNSTLKRVNLAASEAGQLRGRLLNDATEKQRFFIDSVTSKHNFLLLPGEQSLFFFQLWCHGGDFWF